MTDDSARDELIRRHFAHPTTRVLQRSPARVGCCLSADRCDNMAVTPLATLIQQRMDELGIRSGRGLARRTENAPDGALDQATIAKYRKGSAQTPDEQTLRSLAHALALPVQQLRETCGLPRGDLGPFVLPPEADRLDAKAREAVLTVIRALLGTDRA